MPSALADSLFSRLIDAFPPNTHYPPGAFEREPMPPPVVHFLRQLLKRRLSYEVERLDFPYSEWFDYTHADVRSAQRAFVQALYEHGHFPAAEWEAILHQVVHQVAEYLVRPTATLRSFVFQGDEEVVPVDVVERRIGYFVGHAYLPSAVRMFFKQKQVPEIDPVRFAKLLRHIDRQVTADYDTEAWLRLLAPLFDLVRRARLGTPPGIPVPLLQAFFEDKDAEVMLQRVRVTQERERLETLDETGLRQALEPPSFSTPTPSSGRPTASSEEAPGSVPRWKQFQQGGKQAPEAQPQTARSFPRTPDEQSVSTSSKEAIPRWKQYRPEAEPEVRSSASPAPTSEAAPTSLSDVEHRVLGATGLQSRDLFVKHLFGQSTEEYERVLQRLWTAENWAEASQIIADEVFRKHKVNIYSEPAVLFTDATQARFSRPS